MILSAVFRLSVSAACVAGLAAPALAQSVPLPQPRPASLTVRATPPAAPVATPIQPVALAPAVPTEPAPAAAPTSIADIAAATAPSPAAPPPQPAAAPVPVANAAIPPAPTPAATEVAAASSTAAESSAAEYPAAYDSGTAPSAPVDLMAPQQPAASLAPGAELAAANPIDTPTDAQTLKKVNTYFNGIRTLVGNFTQVGPDGSKADGKFFLAKPGKVRFYYQQPSTTDIIADGKSLVVRDRRLATQDVYPLSQTPLKFLLDPNLDLARDSKVVGVYEEPGLVSVAIEEETTFGGKARVLIVFGTEDQKTYELKQWTITDPQGLNTTVAVSELDAATKPDDKLFAVDYTRYKR